MTEQMLLTRIRRGPTTPSDEASNTGVTVYFLHDLSGVFDRLSFPSQEEAATALARNGFERFGGNPSLRTFLIPPSAPFHEDDHPNGPIYSSGEFWQ